MLLGYQQTLTKITGFYDSVSGFTLERWLSVKHPGLNCSYSIWWDSSK